MQLKNPSMKLTLLLLLVPALVAAEPSVWPLPQSATYGENVMPIGPDVKACWGPDCINLPVGDIQDAWVSTIISRMV